MSPLHGVNIVLGITGSIAAYKAAVLARLLIKSGAEVKVIMTEAATNFISPLTLSTLTKNPVVKTMMSHDQWINHVELGSWADLFLIAPCTANTLARMANGLSSDMLVASYLSAKCPVLIAPAMDLDMWKHPSTKGNISKLESFGNKVIQVGYGELASGLTGDGRMAEPEEIIEMVISRLTKKKDLKGKRVLITAGPTHESIDPVRYIGNQSSGKMGWAIARECMERGADVNLIIGPGSLHLNENGLQIDRIRSAKEMYELAIEKYSSCDIAILSAAVADYTPAVPSLQKIKKKEGKLVLELTRTKDIAAEIGKRKKKHQINVGFALETENEEKNALEKLKNKNFDFIVLNSMNEEGAGFQSDTNKVSILFNRDKIIDYSLKSKTKVAEDIVNELVKLIQDYEN